MRPESLKSWGGPFSRFLGVGLAATALQYAVLVAGVELAGALPVRASALGFVCGSVLNYLLNRSYTFRSRVSHLRGVSRFIVIVALGLAANVLFMSLLNGYLGWNYVLSQIVTTGVVMLWNFVGHSLWTFSGG
ncbi:MAG: GtrA family protein [Steroidobacteraceae bacterium]